MAAQRQWREDILGSRFRMLPIAVGDDETAVIIAPARVDEAAGTSSAAARAAQTALTPTGRREPVVPAETAVIYLHGWSDYFFQHWLADHYASLGIAFYAVDLRRYGRSLLIDAAGGPEHWASHAPGADAPKPGEASAQTLLIAAEDAVEDELPGRVLTGHGTRAGFIDDLAAYDEEIAAAFEIIREENPGARVLLHGHSTGGLTLSLWAARHPGEAAALLLNSPWLEFRYDAAARRLMNAWMSLRSMSATPLNVRLPNFYTLASASLGRLPYDLRLKPPSGFPIYPAWLQAIFAGHEQVASGLDLRIPALVQTSAATMRSASFSPSMAAADIVLDVDVIARRALSLGSSVTIEKIPDAMHDVFMSAETPCRRAYDGLARFLYGALS